MYFVIMSTCGCFNLFEQTNIMYFLLGYESLLLTGKRIRQNCRYNACAVY